MTSEYTARDNAIVARLGEEFVIALESNPTTGYEWQVEYDASALRLVEHQFQRGGAAIGAGGTERFRFKAMGETNGRLRAVYKRRGNTPPGREAAFTVRVVGC